jgi:peptidoglycan hydrolase CwlO-like protein
VETVPKEKITFAVIGLCLVIGVMSLLSVFYYTRAADIQNQKNTQVASLQADKADLQQQVTQGNAQITDLNTQLSTFSADNQALKTQVSNLNDAVNYLELQILQLESVRRTAVQGGIAKVYVQ